jgi:PAS domain-containing protein
MNRSDPPHPTAADAAASAEIALKALQDIQQSLRDSQERYRTVFENTGTATFVMAPDKTISLINTGFEKVTGISKHEAEGRLKLSDLISEPDNSA